MAADASTMQPAQPVSAVATSHNSKRHIGAARDERIQVIDAFRGIAILSVLAFHYTARWAPPFEEFDLYGYQTLFPAWLIVGGYGVHLFFVISGLVITMTLVRSANVWEFAARRVARIYPAFLVAATMTFVLMQFGPDQFRVGLADFLSNVLIEARIFGGTSVDGAYWSLVVEVKFYALVFLARAVLSDRFWIGLIGFALLSAIVLAFDRRIATAIMLAPYWPFFLLGIGGWFFIFERRTVVALALFAASATTYVATYELNHTSALNPMVVDGFLLATAIGMLSLLSFLPNIRIPVLAPIGRVSYSLYLIHQYIGVSLIGLLSSAGQPAWLAMLMTTTLMIALATILFHTVEQPGNRWTMQLYRGSAHVLERLVPMRQSGSAGGIRNARS